MITFTADTSAVKKSLEELKETSKKVSESIAKAEVPKVPKAEIPKAEVPKVPKPEAPEVPQPEVPKAVELPKVSESSKKGITASIEDAVGNIKAGGFGSALGAVAKVALPLAVAAAAIKGFQKAFEFAQKMSSKFDPIGTEQVMSKMNASISRMQSAIGSLLMPVFKAMADFVGGIADSVTGIIEGIQTAAAWMNGLIGGTADYLGDAADEVTEATEEASAGLLAFDKLNTLGDVDVAGLTEAERLRQIQAEAYENGQKASKQLVEVFTNVIPNALAGVGAEFGKVVGNISVAIGDIGAEIWNTLSGAWGGFTGAVGNIWETIKTEFGKFTDAVGNALAGAWDSFTGWVGNLWDDISETIGTLGGNIGNAIAGAIRDALNAVGLGWLIDVVDDVSGAVDTAIKVVDDTVSGRLDPFADGGVLGGLNPLNWGNAIGRGVEDFKQNIDVTLSLDGRVLARTILDDIVSAGTRKGIWSF